MITLYPNPQSARIIVKAVADQKKILWVNGPRTLYYNPGITPGSTAGVMCTPSDGGLAFSPDYIVQQGVSGFSTAARTAGLYQGSGLSSEAEDDAAALAVWGGLNFVRGGVVYGAD
jgi:hypothetical protein